MHPALRVRVQMNDPRKPLSDVRPPRNKLLEHSLTPEQSKDLQKLAELYRDEPEFILQRGWSKIASIYGERWHRKTLSGATLQRAVERLLQTDDSKKSNRKT